MRYTSEFEKMMKNAKNLVRFMGGFWGMSGKTKITKSNANDIIHLFSEATQIPYHDLVRRLNMIYPRYEERFLVEQYNRNHGCAIPKRIDVYWPPEIDPIKEGIIKENEV